jgi:hypothetical protein
MKSMRKLRLKKETILTLTSGQLIQAGGGTGTTYSEACGSEEWTVTCYAGSARCSMNASCVGTCTQVD